jgi:nitrate/nitrite transport system substrate-binding protein
MQADKREYTFAQTFPTGTHAMWLYYWLASGGIDPFKDAKVITVPPPQMVANMRIRNMDCFSVGEPWNHRAIMDGIGVSAATSQDVWKDHPEKVLGTTADFVKANSNTARAVTMALLEASRWIDASLQNKQKIAETVAEKAYINTSVDAINQRILGRYQNGLGKTWDDPNHMKFFDDGAVNFPYLSDGMVPHSAQAVGPHKGASELSRSRKADHPDRPLQAGCLCAQDLGAEGADAIEQAH